jgi:hypothetical protein
MIRRGWLLALVLLGLVGCSNAQTRGQAADDPDSEDQDIKCIKTIGDVTDVGNVAPLQISGVGLVINLDGTGGGNPPGQFRQMLEDQLRKQGVKDVKELMSGPNQAMVLVSVQIPAGARRGEMLDVEVTLPPQSKATSLRGGYLVECPLRNYENSRNLAKDSNVPEHLIPGHILGKAHGPLLVGFGEGNEELRLRRGRIWQGGITEIDMPLFLYLKDDQHFASVANAVANKINAAFPDDAQKRALAERTKKLMVLDEVASQINNKFSPGGMCRDDTAHAVNNQIIHVKVPYEYRYNPERYVLAIRLIPLTMTPEQGARYRSRLHQMLLDPKDTIRAALRLEALGKESVPALKVGLSSNQALVRFAAAEALAYLGSTSGIDELGRLADRFESLRGHCLTALAECDEALSQSKLTELMASPTPQLRYGAFRALLVLNETNVEVQGEQLNDAYWLHHVADDSPSMVHISTSRRAEIVIFGKTPLLLPPFTLQAGSEFTVTAAEGDKCCTVSRFEVKAARTTHKQCPFNVEAVLRTIAYLGGQYPDAVEFLRQVERNKCLTCEVKVDCLPVATDIKILGAAGGDVSQFKQIPDLQEDILAVQQELGMELTQHPHAVQSGGGR